MQKRDDGRVLAMKVMRKAHVVEKNHAECVRRLLRLRLSRSQCLKPASRYMRTERDVLTRVDHPYIVTLQYSFQARQRV